MSFPKRYDPGAAEPEIRELWRELDIYRYDPDSGRPCFSVDTPPPYVSAAHLHVGHAMSYTQAEIVVRYKRMRGFNVFYPMGFDDNGLPTERYIEKKHGVLASAMDRREFTELCLRETAEGAKTYRELWDELGISVDWSLTYSTMDERSRRTAQKSFLELARAGLIERREEPIQWCCRCRTSLAQADIETLETETRLHDIAFASPAGRELVISTTRPELLPACVALYANPDDPRYAKLLGGRARVPLLGHEVPIRASDAVDPDFGTGLMMVCTWGDADDVAKWKQDRLETRATIGPDGRLNELAGEFAGLSAGEAREAIVSKLEEARLLRGSRGIEHAVGVHERCETPVEFTRSPQWFIRILEHKDDFLRRGEELNWYPPFMKSRYDDWVRGLKWDWCISRQRAFGVPFPAWYCESCGEPLLARDEDLPVDPTADAPHERARCACGSGEFRGERDVMDTWMTSSLTPLVNACWAEESPRMEVYPQTVRVQAFEIIRTWLFYTVAKSHFHTDTLPWRDVMISGWGLDRNGRKISKRDGNFVEARGVIARHSADALRYWSARATLGHDLRYREEDVAAGRRLLNKLWNAARLVRSLTEKCPVEGEPEFSPADRWIRSRFAATAAEATRCLDAYDYSHALASTEKFFFAEFCDNYLEVVKPRFGVGNAPGAIAARRTLDAVFAGTLKLFAPFVPYVTEAIHMRMYAGGDARSIHVSSWPEPDTSERDPGAEKDGATLSALLTAIRRWKNERSLHANAPIGEILVSGPAELAPLLGDLAAAARAEGAVLGEGGELPTELKDVTLGLRTGS